MYIFSVHSCMDKWKKKIKSRLKFRWLNDNQSLEARRRAMLLPGENKKTDVI